MNHSNSMHSFHICPNAQYYPSQRPGVQGRTMILGASLSDPIFIEIWITISKGTKMFPIPFVFFKGGARDALVSRYVHE